MSDVAGISESPAGSRLAGCTCIPYRMSRYRVSAFQSLSAILIARECALAVNTTEFHASMTATMQGSERQCGRYGRSTLLRIASV